MNPPIQLPAPDVLKTRSKALAALDAILCREWDLRYFSHNAHWAPGQEMSSMRDGEGDDYFLIYAPYGTAIKGCASDSSIQGSAAFLASVKTQIPANFAEFMAEPAFSLDEASFVLWFDESQAQWQAASPPADFVPGDDGGQADLLQCLRNGPDFYRSWAQAYYEVQIDPDLVERVFNHQPISLASLASSGLSIDQDQLVEDLEEIGYPYEK
ncbi:hypothetical protein [Bordetella genomosp. 13]|uniref:hypothetical protein n=1 Tax=Bordetella genomosp. 13 TaxID=463040 RepID=UPI0011AAC6E8|nr:hypothetical protein [Bordetella genomosp. 13]